MGPGQTPEDIQKAAISTTAQATANRQYDSEVAKPVPLVKGGTRLRSGKKTRKNRTTKRKPKKTNKKSRKSRSRK